MHRVRELRRWTEIEAELARNEPRTTSAQAGAPNSPGLWAVAENWGVRAGLAAASAFRTPATSRSFV